MNKAQPLTNKKRLEAFGMLAVGLVVVGYVPLFKLDGISAIVVAVLGSLVALVAAVSLLGGFGGRKWLEYGLYGVVTIAAGTALVIAGVNFGASFLFVIAGGGMLREAVRYKKA
jgi:hypothetical protein